LPKVCPICESRDVMVLTEDGDRVLAVCTTCFTRIDVRR
jgi:hypothetical protein